MGPTRRRSPLKVATVVRTPTSLMRSTTITSGLFSTANELSRPGSKGAGEIGRVGLVVIAGVVLAACGSTEPVAFTEPPAPTLPEVSASAEPATPTLPEVSASSESATPTLPEVSASAEPATPTLPDESFTTPPMPDPSATQGPDSDPYGEQPVPPQIGVLQLAESKSEWAPNDIVAIAYTDPDELASTRSPSYTVHPLIDGEIQDRMYAELAANANRAPIWSPPDDLPEAVNDMGISGVGEDLVLLPPTIPDGSYVICNVGRRLTCTDPLVVKGD